MVVRSANRVPTVVPPKPRGFNAINPRAFPALEGRNHVARGVNPGVGAPPNFPAPEGRQMGGRGGSPAGWGGGNRARPDGAGVTQCEAIRGVPTCGAEDAQGSHRFPPRVHTGVPRPGFTPWAT
jgi:hypothetical protein